MSLFRPAFPRKYRGVTLTRDERVAVADFLAMSRTPPAEAFALVEYLFVADALCMYADTSVLLARERHDPALAQAGCESAQRATMVAPDEPYYLFRFAGCLEAAGATRQAMDGYRDFLARAEKNVGTLGHSPVEGEAFEEALRRARERVAAL